MANIYLDSARRKIEKWLERGRELLFIGGVYKTWPFDDLFPRFEFEWRLILCGSSKINVRLYWHKEMGDYSTGEWEGRKNKVQKKGYIWIEIGSSTFNVHQSLDLNHRCGPLFAFLLSSNNEYSSSLNQSNKTPTKNRTLLPIWRASGPRTIVAEWRSCLAGTSHASPGRTTVAHKRFFNKNCVGVSLAMGF